MNQVSVHCPAHLAFYRSAWLLQEMEIDFELEFHEALPTTVLPDALAEVQVLADAPMLKIDDLVLIEGPSTLHVLIALFGNRDIAPIPSSPAYLRFLQALHFGEGLPHLRAFTSPQDTDAFHHWSMGWVSCLDQALLAVLDYLDSMLAGSHYVAGPAFSAADIEVATFLRGIRTIGGLDDRERLSNYLERLEMRPAYKAFMVRDAAARSAGAIDALEKRETLFFPPELTRLSSLHRASRGLPS